MTTQNRSEPLSQQEIKLEILLAANARAHDQSQVLQLAETWYSWLIS